MKEGKGATRDFGDWLGPMTVKELRQGMRSRNFVAMWSLLLGTLITVTLTEFLAGGAGVEVAGNNSPFFWRILMIVFLVAQPLRGLNAVSNEIRAGTLDNLLLTRLSATRIVFGKWAALFFQTLLLAATLLPFVVIRYHVGGVDMAAELVQFFVLITTSAFLLAVAVGMSVHRSVLMRFFLTACILAAFNMDDHQTWHMFEEFPSAEYYPVVIGYASMVTILGSALVILMGATHLDSSGSALAGRKRLIGLVAVFALLSLMEVESHLGIPGRRLSSIFLDLVAILVMIVSIDAISEKAPQTVGAFGKPGKFTKLFSRLGLGFLFVPGWQHGLFFGLALVTFFRVVSGSYYWDFRNEIIELPIFLDVVGSLCFPVAIQRLLFRASGDSFRTFVLVAAITGGLFGGIYALDHNLDTEFLRVFVTIPLAQLLMEVNGYEPSESFSIFFNLCWIVCAIATVYPVGKKVRLLWKQAVNRSSFHSTEAD